MRRIGWLSVLLLATWFVLPAGAQNWVVQNGVARIASFVLVPQSTAPTQVPGRIYFDSSNSNLYVYDGSSEVDLTAAAGSGAPTDATYLTQTANGSLSAEQALSSLSSGIMRVATTTGVVTSLTTSAGIAANLSDETGTGLLVFGTSPTLTTPVVSGAVTWPSNTRQTFAPGANASGLNVGSVAGDPDTPSNGDLWYDSTANELTGRINGANVALGAGGGSFDGVLTVDSVGTGTTDGFVGVNTTDAANGAQQYSPLIRLTGAGWDADGAASVVADWIAQVRPVQGNTVSSRLTFGYQIAGGGYSDRFTVGVLGADPDWTDLYLGNVTNHTSDANAVIQVYGPNGNVYFNAPSGGGANLSVGGNIVMALNSSSVQLSSTQTMTLNSIGIGTGAVAGRKLTVGRNSSGNGAAGCILFVDAAGTSHALWVDATGDFRTHTACPTEDGTTVSDTAGTVVGSQS